MDVEYGITGSVGVIWIIGVIWCFIEGYLGKTLVFREDFGF